ncbi:MAG: hypothetical protein MZV70_40915 [Desulfobacterales bacterium]|nr:hypothetical protein [Desulfobacterales bacterium]
MGYAQEGMNRRPEAAQRVPPLPAAGAAGQVRPARRPAAAGMGLCRDRLHSRTPCRATAEGGDEPWTSCRMSWRRMSKPSWRACSRRCGRPASPAAGGRFSAISSQRVLAFSDFVAESLHPRPRAAGRALGQRGPAARRRRRATTPPGWRPPWRRPPTLDDLAVRLRRFRRREMVRIAWRDLLGPGRSGRDHRRSLRSGRGLPRAGPRLALPPAVRRTGHPDCRRRDPRRRWWSWASASWARGSSTSPPTST